MGSKKENSLLSQLKVLYVEDEEFTRDELSFFLKKRVGKLFVACNGEEGLKLAKIHQPDIALVDLRMPVMDGLTMCRRIKEEGGRCAFIIASALSDSETILQAVDIGIVKYIVKPVDPYGLLETMEKIAEEYFRNQFKQQTADKLLLMERKERMEMEKKVKTAVAYFMKSTTGKGPRDVQVFITRGQIEIRALEVLTILEQSVISNSKNIRLVEYLRRIFYAEKGAELENVLKEVLDIKLKINQVQANVAENRDCIILELE
ncbi:Na-translocating system protein MpsC family protein [Thermosyntropha sp.]|uniref:Na-translocating system protein MpsC family protein n=1 Tax=Thermosyntropha sp. TaxID=2740820 RepID=UPI0025EE1012|nr:Na-translocating system protein MpsC family protein [Thermosyntropha sp.]MBO8159489.1 DUF2294 family protein [Thermosyntropha sp.]